MMPMSHAILRVLTAAAIVVRRHGRSWRITILAATLSVLWLANALAVNVGAAAPEFVLPELGVPGKRIDSRDLLGKVIFVDFWASWCGPCRQSLPMYVKLRKEISRADFVILAINVDENGDDARRFLEAHPVDYPVLRDPQGSVPGAFGVLGMPSSYVIDRRGIVRARHVGFVPADIDALRKQVNELLGPDRHDDR